MFTNLSSTRRLSSYDEEEPEQTEEEKQKERNEAKEQCRFNRGCTLGLNNEGKRENLADWCSKKVTLWEEFHEKAYALPSTKRSKERKSILSHWINSRKLVVIMLLAIFSMRGEISFQWKWKSLVLTAMT